MEKLSFDGKKYKKKKPVTENQFVAEEIWLWTEKKTKFAMWAKIAKRIGAYELEKLWKEVKGRGKDFRYLLASVKNKKHEKT